MLKKIIISFLVTVFLLNGSLFFTFFYSQRAQQFIIQSLNLKKDFNQKLQEYISDKVNDKNIRLNVAGINFLEPAWPNLLRIELDNVNIHLPNQREKSNIKIIELGFSYDNILNNIFSKNKDLTFDYFKFNNLTVNGNLQKNKFIPGPLIKFLLSVNKEFTKKTNLKQIWKNQILIDKINFLLLDTRNELEEKIFNINCKNISVSSYINKARSVNMNCKDNDKVQFSVRGELAQNFNKFYGKIKNINHNLFQHGLSKFDEINVNTRLNGSYEIITNKNFKPKEINFLSQKSIISFADTINSESILETKFNGEISWRKKENIINFKNISFPNKSIGTGSIDLLSKEGSIKVKFEKITLEVLEKNMIAHHNYFKQYFTFSKIKNYFDVVNSGSFNEMFINLNFSYLKKFKITDVKGYSDFKNVTVQHQNTFFKKKSSALSGNLKFEAFYNNNRIIDKYSWIEMNINASKGALFFQKLNWDYEFDRASFKLKINRNNLKISKASFIRNNQTDINFKDINIENKILKDGFLKINNSKFFSHIIKNLFNIDLLGAAEFNLALQGDFKNLDFTFILDADLSRSYLASNLLNVVKNKNIPASIKSKLSFKNGKLISLKDVILKMNKDIYKIQSVLFNDYAYRKIILKNITSKQFLLNRVNISRSNKETNILISGKKIDLSNLKNNIKNNFALGQKIVFDITTDKIIFNPQIVLSGNIKGTIHKSVFKSTAYGQMWLANASILESGKLNILIDDNLSTLYGIGLTGGAETKIKLIKKNNHYPELSFETSNGGNLLKALGYTPNIRSGEMKIDIKFLNDSYDQYEGIITSQNFSLINAPGIINSLSILSFSGIQSIISGEGVLFNKGKAKIFVADNTFNFDKLYLSSESLGISARGKLNLKDQVVDLRGSVAPIKIISKFISLVPAVGELITGIKKEGLIAGQFKMQGPIEKPKVNLNFLSFAPGIFREIFADDWLDENNFFVKNKDN